jgi:hypothetical protein
MVSPPGRRKRPTTARRATEVLRGDRTLFGGALDRHNDLPTASGRAFDRAMLFGKLDDDDDSPSL